ncbi:hypothetical protein DR64_7907 [Paraburkholderia xenovorans LB400]|uniref:hypothetical protein n=1 Tax=Paraburkholderia xenovorans TaxID=36873 RepID=UPI00003C4C87|nr:hypothetical protein [Paraburkholderia xenovorans]AIP34181.1 hypothetical protein DR64_7907 [Paraburkholderia xenovorans LB400]
MNTDTDKRIFAEFDDFASKSEDVNVQFLIQAMKLHAEITNSRLADIEQALLALRNSSSATQR